MPNPPLPHSQLPRPSSHSPLEHAAVPCQIMMSRHARRQILRPGAPSTLPRPQSQLEHATLVVEAVIDPIVGKGLPIQSRTLDVDILIRRVEIDVADRGHIARELVRGADLLEKRRRDEVDVLARVRKRPHHRQSYKAPHTAAVVVARDACGRCVELAGDVGVDALCGLGGTAGIVVLEDGQEVLLVSLVSEAALLEIIKTAHKSRGAAEGGDQCGLVVGNEKGVEPRAAFVGLVAVRVQIAFGEVEEGGAEDGV